MFARLFTFRCLLPGIGGEADQVAVSLDEVDGHALPERPLLLGLKVELLLRPDDAVTKVLEPGAWVINEMGTVVSLLKACGINRSGKFEALV